MSKDRWQTAAERRAEMHARSFTPSQMPHDPHVTRLASEGFNIHQIAMLTRRPIIDIRLILAGVEQAALKAEGATRVRRRRRRA